MTIVKHTRSITFVRGKTDKLYSQGVELIINFLKQKNNMEEVNYEKIFTALSDKTFNGQLKWIPVSRDHRTSFMTMFTTETGQRYNVFLTYTKLHQEWDYYVDSLEFFDENNVSLLQLHELDWSTEEGYIINRLIKEILLEHYKEVNELERQSKEREKKEQEERNMRKQTIVDELAQMISHISCGIVKK